MTGPLAERTLADLSVGQEFSFSYRIGEEQMARFAELSGDVNPLHVSDEFAHDRGFAGRVVYGALHVAKISRMIGMECPGRDALFTRLDISFRQPLYVGQEATLTARIEAISESVGALVLAITIVRDGGIIATARAETLLRGVGTDAWQ